MYRGRATGGYTIVELLIFLAVSSAMFVSAMALLSGRQARTEFQQSMGNLSSELQDIANDVSTGYYAPNQRSGGSFSCAAAGGVITLSPSASDTQGANSSCIFIGKAIKFRPDGNSQDYVNMTLIGQRQTSAGINVQTLAQAGIKAAVASNAGIGVDTSTTTTINGGARFDCMLYYTSPNPTIPDAPCSSSAPSSDVITFITTFVATGNASVNVLMPSRTVNTSRTIDEAATDVENYVDQRNSVKNPAGGIYICVNSTGSDQHGLITIGGNASGLSTDFTISQGKCR